MGLAAPQVPLWRSARARGILLQVLLLVALVGLIAGAGLHAAARMQAQNIPTGFGFLQDTAGFDINLALIPFQAGKSTFAQAFWVGLLNTGLVCVISLLVATLVGFVVGLARLSPSYVMARLATLYVETLRNIPLPLQLLFWYNAILTPLPNPRQAVSLFQTIFLHNRGMVVPEPVTRAGFSWVILALCVGVCASLAFARWARRRQEATGQRAPVLLVSASLIVLPSLVVFFALGQPLHWDVPHLQGFNFVGGVRILPELVALALGLSLYTASFIAEVVRSGVQAVPRGQLEAAQALGLSRAITLRQVVVPQAMRVIVPPLTNQYLNLIKNSSLAVFVGYPDLVQVFGDKVREQSTASVQVVFLTMAVYLAISLAVSGVMGVINARMQLVER